MSSPTPLPFGRAAAALVLLLAAGPSLQAEPVHGVVFDDQNADGVRQAGEAGLGGVVVSNQVDVVQTAADGAYELPGRGYGVAYVSAPRGRTAVGAFWRSIPPGSVARIDFPLAASSDTDDFTFIHASDTHLAPESVSRTRALIELVALRKPDLVMVSGDLIKDALRVGEGEATSLYELYVKEMGASTRPIWSGPGNHEIFGIERHLSLVSPKNPLYGKNMYRKHLGPNYYSFNRGRIHFIALDTLDIEDLWYYGHVDQAQLDWLVKDLSFVPKGATVVTFNHVPFFSAGMSVSGYTDWGLASSLIRAGPKMFYRHVVSNAADVIDRLKDHRYTLSLAGHNHSYEHLSLSPYAASETRLHLTAAVIGPRPGLMPSPSGVTFYRVKGEVIDDGEFLPLDGPGSRTPGGATAGDAAAGRRPEAGPCCTSR